MNSRTLERIGLTSVTVEAYDGTYDSQGIPSYASGVSISARVVETDDYIRKPDGSEVRLHLDVWVPADASVLPDREDRITHESRAYIVEQRKERRTLRTNELHHVRCRCREDG